MSFLSLQIENVNRALERMNAIKEDEKVESEESQVVGELNKLTEKTDDNIGIKDTKLYPETCQEEKNMKNSNLVINENCIQCGSCLGCGFDFLETTADGTVCVRPGTILATDGEEIKTLKDVCPVDAFELSKTEDEASILDKLLKELKEYQGLPKPTEAEFKFDKDEYDVPIPLAQGEYRYDYSSDRAAERAALSEFERAMYSQINTIILRIITEYRVKKVKPYYSALVEEGSVYAISNKKVSEILHGIKRILGDKLPEDFSKVEVMPDRDLTWKMLNKGELLSDNMVSTVRKEFEYPSSQYDCYWRTDDMEMYVGMDRKGNSKYQDKYCYKDIDKAFKELAKDIKNACGWASSDLEYSAVTCTSCLVDVYNKQLEDVLKQKIRLVEQCR